MDGGRRLTPLLLFLPLSLTACNEAADTAARVNGGSVDSNCYVQLFERADFKGENIFVRGAGEHPNLKQLPDSNRDWSGAAVSFKTGPRTLATIWRKPDFEGQSASWNGRTETPLMTAPRSMKIACKG